jgi:hypothetical protein
MGLVFNAGIKPDYQLPGMSKYLPAFRVAGAGGNAGQSHSVTCHGTTKLICSKNRIMQSICMNGSSAGIPASTRDPKRVSWPFRHGTSLPCIVTAHPKMVDT